MQRTGCELIAHYLSPDRRPTDKQWSRKHADTQRDLRERDLRPADVTRLGQAVGLRCCRYELMVYFAAYTGPRWGGDGRCSVPEGVDSGFQTEPTALICRRALLAVARSEGALETLAEGVQSLRSMLGDRSSSAVCLHGRASRLKLPYKRCIPTHQLDRCHATAEPRHRRRCDST